MKTIYQLQQMAARLRAMTEVNSISAEDTFGLQADILEYLADMEQNAEGLGIHKVYASYAAMVADAAAPIGSNGKALRFGQLVVIYDPSNTAQSESGNVYAWQKGNSGASAWLLMENVGDLSDYLPGLGDIEEQSTAYGNALGFVGKFTPEYVIDTEINGGYYYLNQNTSNIVNMTNSASASYCHTYRFAVQAGDVVACSTNVGADGRAAIFFSDAARTAYTVGAQGSNGVKEYTATAINDGYAYVTIKVSTDTDNGAGLGITVTRNRSARLDGMEAKMESMEDALGGMLEGFDVSAGNASGGTPATYATLAEALAAVPEARRWGGMTVKYIDSASGKYVQYRYLLASTSSADFTDAVNWKDVEQGCDLYGELLEVPRPYQPEAVVDADTYVNISNGNYYAIEGTGTTTIKRFPNQNFTTYMFSVKRGDVVKCDTQLKKDAYAIFFSSASDKDTLYAGARSTEPNTVLSYEATAPLDGYAYVTGKAPSNFWVVPADKSERLDGIERSLEEMEEALGEMKPSAYYGEMGGGELHSSQHDKAFDNRSLSVELYFKVAYINTEGNNPTTDIFYSSSTYMFRVFINKTGNLCIALNVGSNEAYVGPVVAVGDAVHVVLECTRSGTSLTKKAYVNGQPVATKANDNYTAVNYVYVLRDTLHDNQVYYLRRIWGRALADGEVQSLYNHAYPLELVMPDSLRRGLVSCLQPSGMSAEGWKDTVEGTLHEWAQGVTLYAEKPVSQIADTLAAKTALCRIANVFNEHIYPQFEPILLTHGNHDCTFTDDDKILVGHYTTAGDSPDGKPYGCFYERRISTGAVTRQIYVRFYEEGSDTLVNQLKSVDYKWGKLLLGSGRAKESGEATYEEQGSYALIIHGVDEWTGNTRDEALTLNDCIYEKIDLSGLGVKSYAFWGARPDTLYVSCNFMRDIFLIRLGKGSVNLGMGNFDSEALSGMYNGSYQVIGHWHQDKDWLQMVKGQPEPMAAHGGQFHKGYLYLALNHLGTCTIYKCLLHDYDGECGELKFDVIHLDEYLADTDGSPYYQYRYIDGLALRGDKIYAQPLDVGSISTQSNLTTTLVADI